MNLGSEHLTDEELYQKIVNSNPFDYEQANKDFVSLSFDDYHVVYNGNKVRFGDVISDATINHKERIKFTKNQIKAWDRDYQIIKQQKYNNIIEEVRRNIDYKIKTPRISLTIINFIIIAILGALSYFGDVISNWLSGFNLGFTGPICDILLKVSESFKQFNTPIFYVYCGVVAGFVLVLFGSIYYSRYAKTGERYLNKIESLLKVRSKKIDKKVKKAIKKANKYYLKVVTEEKPYKPLLISEVQLDFTVGAEKNRVDNHIYKLINKNKKVARVKALHLTFRVIEFLAIVAFGVMVYLIK